MRNPERSATVSRAPDGAASTSRRQQHASGDQRRRTKRAHESTSIQSCAPAPTATQAISEFDTAVDVEFLRRSRHARQRLCDRHRRRGVALLGLVEAHRVDARHHVVAQVRRAEAALRQRRDDALHLVVDIQQSRGVAFPLAQARRQRALAEAVHLLEECAVGAAGEARRLAVENAERQQLRRLEFRGELRLARLRLPLDQAARHADHLEAAILEVVRLLGVEREDAIRERLVRRDERDDLPQAEHLRRRQPMAAIRRPEPAILAAHHDERIEERAGLVDLGAEALDVRGRQVALKGSGLHGVERQRGEQQRAPAERLVICADGRAARLRHECAQLGNFGAVRARPARRSRAGRARCGPAQACRGRSSRRVSRASPARDLPIFVRPWRLR